VSDYSNTYWAACPGETVGADLVKRVDDYYEDLETSGLADVMRRSFYTFYGVEAGYGATFRGLGEPRRGGAQGELVLLNANHYRSLIEHMVNLVCSQRPALIPRAVNTDAKSQEQVAIASGIIEYYMRERRFDRLPRRAVECALVLSAAWVRLVWDPNAGGAYGVDPTSGQQVREGDLEADLFTPFDVIYDRTIPHDRQVWRICRVPRGKWDLIASYPEFQEQIIASSTKASKECDKRELGLNSRRRSESDLVYVYEFYHKRTPALPEGRCVQFLDSGDVLTDGGLPYDDIPLYRVSATEMIGSATDYTSAWSLLSLQQLMDLFISILATNYDAFGVQNVVMQDGTTITEYDMAGGTKVWKIPPGAEPPAGINLTTLPQDFLRSLQLVQEQMETLSAINSVVRGNPEASLKTGPALALVQSQALQALNTISRSKTDFEEDLGTGLIRVLKAYANTPRVAAIAGANNNYALAAWSSSDLENIDRVVVDSGNPLAQTMAGKVQLFDLFKQANVPMDAEQVVELMTSGTVEPVYEGPQRKKLQVREENELLAKGPPVVQVGVDPLTGQPIFEVPDVPVIFTDDPVLHFQENASVLYTQEARTNPAVVQAVLAHLMGHVHQLRTMDPALAQALKFPSLQPLEPNPMGAELPQTAPSAGDQAHTATPANSGPTEPVTDMPPMPVNPLTGERAPGPTQ